ncbi:MAG: hypothetical protein NTV54_01310 [Ignavibacteriales bacterium]|nr:hypothetical protein [Ignavibacteriales bacterium]
MKHTLKILTWTLVVTSVIALPLLLMKRWDVQDRRSINIRYDINDSLFDLEA